MTSTVLSGIIPVSGGQWVSSYSPHPPQEVLGSFQPTIIMCINVFQSPFHSLIN